MFIKALTPTQIKELALGRAKGMMNSLLIDLPWIYLGQESTELKSMNLLNSKCKT
jgi:hypothetical protein